MLGRSDERTCDSSDEADEVCNSTATLNYFEQSTQKLEGFADNDSSFSHGIQTGLQLSQKCVTQLTTKLESTWKRKYTDFYDKFLKPEQMLRLLKTQPDLYKRGTLQIDSSHGALCKVKDAKDGIDTIVISGRSKCGKAYTDDEVVVEILTEKNMPVGKQDPKPSLLSKKTYGRVVGVLERQRKQGIEHPVFVCELDNFDNDQVKPICKTIPKLQLIRSSDYKGFFTVDLYDYNEDRKVLVKKHEPVKITPERRRKYLFYVVYVSWTSIYPLGVAIDIHKSTKNLLSGMSILELQYEVPTLYKPKTVKKLQNSLDVNFQDLKIGREDFTEILKVFTIDPQNSSVLDDALSVEKLENGNTRVGVHISDVTAYIDKNDEVDIEAKARGTTFFAGSFSHPHYMLPEPLSIETCSLLPGRSRLTTTIFLYFNKDLEFKGYRFFKSYIKSSAKLTYQHVQNVIKNNADSEMKDEILSLYKIASFVRKNRLGDAMWGIPFEFDFDDVETETDCFEAYFTVSEFMTLVNDTVARVLMGNNKFKKCVPLRCHDAPSTLKVQQWLKSYPKLIDQIVQLQNVKPMPAKQISLQNFNKDGEGIRYNDISYIQKWLWKEFQCCMGNKQFDKAGRILCKDELHPFQAVALDEWFSIQENGKYRCSGDVDKNGGFHFGLNTYPYVHFTAPIRRFVDVVVHRQLNAVLSQVEPPYNQEEISEICAHMNKMSHKAKQFETKSKSLLLANKIAQEPKIIYGFVKKFTDQDICFVFPGMKFLNEELRTLPLEYLDLSCQPDFKNDNEKISSGADREVLVLGWERRVYSKNKWRPIPKIKRTGYMYAAPNEAQRLDPHQRIEVHSMDTWVKYLQTAIKYGNLNNSAKHPKDEMNLFRYISTTFFTEFDVNCELEKQNETPNTSKCYNDEGEEEPEELDTVEEEASEVGGDVKQRANIITKQTCNFSMSFSHGQVVSLQMAASIQKGIFTPYIQMVDLTKNIIFCTEHMRDPVSCLEKYSVEKPKTTYTTPEEYQQIWLPIIAMESVVDSVRSDTILINEVKLRFTGNGGFFYLSNEFCSERNIVLGSIKTEFREDEENNIVAIGEEQPSFIYTSRYDYLCIKCRIFKGNSKDQNP